MKKKAKELIEQAYLRGYRAGQENALVVDSDKCIEQGRNEAWEAAQKILNVCCSSSSQVLDEVFGTPSVLEIINTCLPSEAIAKLRAYEEQQKKQQDDEEFEVGDEVVNTTGNKGVVIGISKTDLFLFISELNIPQVANKTCCKKTGRTFPEVVEVLKKMQEDIK